MRTEIVGLTLLTFYTREATLLDANHLRFSLYVAAMGAKLARSFALWSSWTSAGNGDVTNGTSNARVRYSILCRASSRTSAKHTGVPWSIEIGLLAHQLVVDGSTTVERVTRF